MVNWVQQAYYQRRIFLGVLTIATVLLQIPTHAETASEIDTKVENLISKMSLEEKVAQMRIFHAKAGVNYSKQGKLVLNEEVKERLKFGIAGVKNPGEFLSPERAADLNNQLQEYIIENNRHGIPALFITEAYNGVDAEGTTRFGRPINMAATWNPELVERVWDTIGREARLRGLHMCHSPEADVMRDPRFGRMSESYSEDTYLTTEMVVAAVKGVQGRQRGLSKTHIGAVTKHFAGYGQVEGGLNFAAVSMSPLDLADEILPPFKAAVQRGHTLGVMAAHGDLNGVASHANYDLLTRTLRDDWGFDGYVVSDANDIARLFFFMGVAQNPKEAALLGLKAGVDVDLYSDEAYALLPELARKDPSLVALIDRSAGRVLRTKFILGLFDNPYVDVSSVAARVRNGASLSLARAADAESIVLLKNERQLLPLNRDELDGKTVALIGPVLAEDTLTQFAAVFGPSVNLVAEQGFELTDRDPHEPRLLGDNDNWAGLERAVAAAAKADYVVLFLGGDEFTAKEAYFARGLGDRTDIKPVGLQNELIEKVKRLDKPAIVALKHRRTLAITKVAQHADAILDAWDLSEQGDRVLAETIIGMHNPSGKLPVTVPRSIGQIPFHYSRKAINFKKRYLFDEPGPLYPFGFGLSYSDFEVSNLTLSAKNVKAGNSLAATITLSNKGQYEGKEVVQLYIQDLVGSVVRPRKVLKGFQKVLLAPGERRQISFEIDPDMLMMTNANGKRVLEPGEFAIEIGTSSVATLRDTFIVTDR